MKLFSKIILLISCAAILSCKKDSTDQRYCWQVIDNSGNDLNVICDKTESELLACTANGSCGTFNGGAGLTGCNYYKIEENKYCWQINNIYYDSLTESQAKLYARCFFGNVVPVQTNCISCQWWFHREKSTFKPANTTTYSAIRHEKFCGDTLATLFQGRQIIRKDDTDSLIVIQFSNNGTSW